MVFILLAGVLTKLAHFSVESVLDLSRAKELVEKLKSLYGIREEVEKLHRELMYIHEFIRDADEKPVVDRRQMRWVKDVMDIAYQIEDAVDIFLLKCPQEFESIIKNPRTLPKKIKQFPFLYNFQDEIKSIQDRIREIHEYKTKYGINTLDEGKKPQPDPGLKLDAIGNPEPEDFHGFDTHRDNVVKYLLDDQNKSLAVVSIVGIGGLGKTTLARMVCLSNEVIQSFGDPIWVTISQKYHLLDILRKIAQNLNIESTDLNGTKLDILRKIAQNINIESTDLNGTMLANRIWKSLKEKRYLIVLDDVWTEELWVEIAKALPNMKNGSRVLITTRIASVAKKADTTYDPYELPFLDVKSSRELFRKKAVPKKHQYPNVLISGLGSLVESFVVKCEGLPLALVVLGGLLSKEPYNFHAWNKLLQTISWQDDGNECTKIIATSYDHLPLAKKLCFLYFAAFPKDEKIEAKSLFQIWIAEQLIPCEEKRTLEETAECFLEDLVQRSMVLVSKRFPDGSIQYCGLHDVMRNLAIKKAKENNFLMVCSKEDDWEWCNKARRVAIHYSNNIEPIGNYASPNVRSLLFFGESCKVDCSKYRVLRVLGSMKGRVELESFKGSPHLRYLQLNVDNLKREADFGEWIKGMKYLETINLRSSENHDLSPWIYQIKTLRHVLLSPLGMKTQGLKTQEPPTPLDLRYLQTIRNLRYNKSWEKSVLPNIPEVRELDIQIIRIYPRFPLLKREVEKVANLLHTLEHIVYLKTQAEVINLQVSTTKKFPFYENLKSLVLINYQQDHSDDTRHLPREVHTSQNCKKRCRSSSPTSRKKRQKSEPETELLLGEYSAQPSPLPSSTVLSSTVLSSLPAHLTELRLEGYEFESDPMLELEKLGSLNTLWIRGTSQQNPLTIKCTAGCFKQLEKLVLKELELVEWKIEMGAMPILKRLAVKSCHFNKPFEKSYDLTSSLQYLKWEPEPISIRNLKKQRPDLQPRDDNDIED